MSIFSWIFGRGARGKVASPPTQPATTAPTVVAPGVSDYTLADAYSGLRGQVLALKPEDFNSPDGQPFAILMETGYPEAVASLVVIADGTTSLYFSNGGGVIGAGGYAPVRAASTAFLDDVSAFSDGLEIVTDCPLPKRGQVRFYLLTGNGIRTAEASEQDLGNNRHKLSPVFHSGHAVISAVRENSAVGP